MGTKWSFSYVASNLFFQVLKPISCNNNSLEYGTSNKFHILNSVMLIIILSLKFNYTSVYHLDTLIVVLSTHSSMLDFSVGRLYSNSKQTKGG